LLGKRTPSSSPNRGKDVADGVDLHLQIEITHPGTELVTPSLISRGKRHARTPAGRVSAETRQLGELGVEQGGINGERHTESSFASNSYSPS